MGKRLKLVSDSSRARSAKAGSQIVRVHPIIHSRLGAAFIDDIYRSKLHWSNALVGRSALGKVHADFAALPIENTNARHVNASLAWYGYEAGAQMVVETVHAVQHLLFETRPLYEAIGGEVRIDVRRDLLRLATALDVRNFANTARFAKFVEIQKIRDRIAHPRSTFMKPGNETNWDKSPLGWFFTERSVDSFDCFRVAFEDFRDEAQHRLENTARPARYSIERGIVSTYPAKHPSR